MFGRSPVSRCVLCGARHSTCGPRGTGTPVDVYAIPGREPDMSELAEYDVTANGVTTTMMLNDTDAARLNARRRTRTAAPTGDQVAQEEANVVHGRSRATVANKARKSSTSN